MKKFNWKVRLKNPTFWLTFLPTVIAFGYSVLGAFEVVPAVSQDSVIKLCTIIISALASLGVLVDPTTKGVADSKRALGYNEPYEEQKK